MCVNEKSQKLYLPQPYKRSALNWPLFLFIHSSSSVMTLLFSSGMFWTAVTFTGCCNEGYITYIIVEMFLNVGLLSLCADLRNYRWPITLSCSNAYCIMATMKNHTKHVHQYRLQRKRPNKFIEIYTMSFEVCAYLILMHREIRILVPLIVGWTRCLIFWVDFCVSWGIRSIVFYVQQILYTHAGFKPQIIGFLELSQLWYTESHTQTWAISRMLRNIPDCVIERGKK